MKRNLFHVILVSLFAIIACSKVEPVSYDDPSTVNRLSIDFLVSPSVGSPYDTATMVFLPVLMAANHTMVSSVDFIFYESAIALDTVSTSAINTVAITDNIFWNMQHSAFIDYTIPVEWTGKTITVKAFVNGKSTSADFVVK